MLVRVYAVLAVAGLVGTWWFNLQGSAPDSSYLADWFATPASSSAAVDLVVVAVAASVFMVVEGRRVGLAWSWLLVPLTVLVAVACTLPAFLALRERRLAARSSADGADDRALTGVTA